MKSCWLFKVVIGIVLFTVCTQSAHAGTTLWPKPQSESPGSHTFTLTQASFALSPTGVTSDILTTAIDRYQYIIFGGATAAPVSFTPSGAVTSLQVNVKTDNTSLSLTTDESCT